VTPQEKVEKGQVMAEAHNLMLVRRAVEEIWNKGNLTVANVLFTADYVNHAGLIPNLVRGPEAIKISVALYRTAFPNFHITMDELTTARNAVLLRWTARGGTPQGTLTGILISRIDGDKIAESWMQWNQEGVMKQIGLRPARVDI
jgi:hypothetical protein